MTESFRDDDAAQPLRDRLVRYLVASGELRDPALRRAFERVPRHAFVARYFRQTDDGRYEPAITTGFQRLAYIYGDRALVTQIDGDDTVFQRACQDVPVRGIPTSSSSQPMLMAQMLEDLDLRDGQNVLEVGTGSGYNAALLCERLGETNVTTIDIDPALIRSARDALDQSGYAPTVVVADGAVGYPPRAPYDRLICTYAVPRIPESWLGQTAPGGAILANIYRELDVGALVLLTVGDGTRAEGCFLPGFGSFMPPRSHTASDAMALFAVASKARGNRRETPVDGNVLEDDDFRFFAAFQLDVTTLAFQPGGEGEWQTWLLHRDGSWAYHIVEADHSVADQGGPRHLWSVLETAHEEWIRLGKPHRDRFGLSVARDGHTLWLDSPDGHRWPVE